MQRAQRPLPGGSKVAGARSEPQAVQTPRRWGRLNECGPLSDSDERGRRFRPAAVQQLLELQHRASQVAHLVVGTALPRLPRHGQHRSAAVVTGRSGRRGSRAKRTCRSITASLLRGSDGGATPISRSSVYCCRALASSDSSSRCRAYAARLRPSKARCCSSSSPIRVRLLRQSEPRPHQYPPSETHAAQLRCGRTDNGASEPVP